MTDARADRGLPNRFVRHFFQAFEEQMGAYSLHMLLHQAGLERYIASPPPLDNRVEVRASAYAAFQKSLRDYYGRGARGSLNRIGRSLFQCMRREAPPGRRLQLAILRRLPRAARCKRCLELLASWLSEPGGSFSVHSLDLDLALVTRTSDPAFGQTSGEPICWVTLGIIQEALLWVTGEEYEVEEMACQAAGAEACIFKISHPLPSRSERSSS